MYWARPESLYDRETEWNDLTSFVSAPRPMLRLGILYGRRRFGKSFLLRRLVDTGGGLYHLAIEQEPLPALDRFAETVAGLYPTPPPLSFGDWGQALRHTVDMLGKQGGDRPHLLVLDEYPYLQKTNPELDSTLQALLDEASGGEFGKEWTAPVSIVLCGSAMSVMTDLLSGTSPLRGRASLDLPLSSFDFREARGYWGIQDYHTAFRLHSIVGGAAGYRDLTAGSATPRTSDDIGAWLAATLLNPSHALFREDEYLLREDPRVSKESLYYSLLRAISDGNTSQTGIASAIGRKVTDITYHLDVMTKGGFVTKDADLLSSRKPVYRIADPIVRFHELITRRYQAPLEDRKTSQVWDLAQDTYRSNIIGPHFEAICRTWTARYASELTLGGTIGPVRSLQVHGGAANGGFELDVVATTEASQGRKRKSIQVIGEAKGTNRPRSLRDLNRLEKAGAALGRLGDVSVGAGAKLFIFSLSGFEEELVSVAAARDDLELVDLERLYTGE